MENSRLGFKPGNADCDEKPQRSMDEELHRTQMNTKDYAFQTMRRTMNTKIIRVCHSNGWIAACHEDGGEVPNELDLGYVS